MAKLKSHILAKHLRETAHLTKKKQTYFNVRIRNEGHLKLY